MSETKYTISEIQALQHPRGSGSADNLLDAAKSNWVIIIAVVALVWNLWQGIGTLEDRTIANQRDIEEANRIVLELAGTVEKLAEKVQTNTDTDTDILSDLRLIKEKLNIED